MNAPIPEFLRSTQIFNDYMTPDAIALVERAKAMAPRLAERAFEAENKGMVPVETVRELAEAGFFKVLQPQRWGGYEMDPRVFYRVQMALAEGCMATALSLIHI